MATATATVLAHPDPGALDTQRPFKDLGIDSLTALELRNTLTTQTGLSLPATVIFDQPTPAALAGHLVSLLGGAATSVVAATRAPARVDEPVAVVGMACRFPGGIDSAAGLWDLVAAGVDAVGGFPTDRGWDLAGLFDRDPDAVGKTYTRAGAFLPDAAGFDAEFFGISAREAQTMDPQQRLLLEVCWEALETAGIDPAALAGSDAGVFAGTWTQPYGGGGSDSSEGYELTGSSSSVASGRVSYILGLQGPAITVDTACSSSLVATHLACQSLRNGESSLALAGGVTVMATPLAFTELARQRGLAADGRCKAFAAAADGVGFGEGAAVLVLERLSDAQRNQHPVLAVIAGSAVNQDGASNGLTAPNGPAQQRVIAQAVANAGIGLDQVDVVEAHGTGTTLGDPIEAGALIETYGAARSPERPLWLGSIKSNIGHTQAAAGAAGIIKMVAALQHGILPATLHVDAPSSHIDWSADTVRLLTEPVPWPETDHPRTAGVSSFGISGTNAHLILQQAPEPVVSVVGGGEAGGGEAGGGEAVGEPALSVWAVSARHPAALSAQAGRLQRYLLDHPGLDLSDVAYSLATTRTHHPHRAAITVPADSGDPVAELLGALGALSVDRPYPGLTRHHHVGGQASKIVFVFPGQGAQYPGMGAQLYRHHRGFARLVDECDQALAPWTGWSVRDVLCQEPGAPSLERVDVVQPVLFTMMVSLAEVLGSYGIVPDAVIGHSQGEIAAAYVAGALTLAQAAKVVALRSAALVRLSGSGAMASVMLAAEQLGPRLQQWGAALSIAAINGPSHSIVSGDVDAVQQFSAACEQDGIQVWPIAADYASHSAQVEALREQLLRDLAGLTPQPARVALYSTVASAHSGDPLDTTVMDAEYWYRNLREPVGFHDTAVALLAHGEHTFVELSPHLALAPAINDIVASVGGRAHSVVIPTLHQFRPELDALAAALARLHTHGHSPSWRALYPHADALQLPTYPFQHRRYWLVPTPAAEASDPAEGVLWKAVDEGELDTVAKVLRLSDDQLGDDQRAASLGPVVHALRQWRKDLGDRSKVNKLRYRVGWQTITPETSPRTRQRWLVLAWPEQAEDDAWIAGLSGRYADDIDVLAIDPSDVDRSSMTALMSSAAERTGCDGVVSFLALEERTHPGFPGISTGLIATLCVAQAYGDCGLGVPLWVITQGAVSVCPDDGAARPSQSAVWGLGQSVGLEHPQWWGGLIDLPDLATPHDVEQLHAILSCPQPEDQLAIRPRGVSARRVREAPLPLERVRAWTASGTALVTGATGRLGGHIVRWLAEAGASHLVLLSRNATHSPRAAELEKELNAAGVATTLASVDMTDRSALADVIAGIRDQHGPIRTVVHAAAAIGLHTISEVTTAEFASDYAKAVGADNLAELLDDEPPETFILFSSAAGIWGGTEQGCYAAANAHLDALASRLRARGCMALSVAWGLWAGQEGTRPEILDYFHRIGINSISPEIALSALQQSLDADDAQITIADVSWKQFLEVFTARRSRLLLSELVAADPSAHSTTTTTAISEALAARLASQTPEQRLHTLTALVIDATAAVLAHPDPAALDTDRPFQDLGIDSLTALELRNSLSTQTGLSLPSTLVFDHPTPTQVAAHLEMLVSGTGAPALGPLARVAGRVDEPVAVVGMACRFPGGVDSAAGLWDLVAAGVDAVGGFPADRGWDLAGLFDPDPDAVGKTYTRAGAFLPDAAGFDAEFFGISAREAHAMDPQQRLFLEVCWEALETAGIDPAALAGSDAGVFAGTWTQQYGAAGGGGSEGVEGYVSGSLPSVASGRVSYILGLQGPAITVDTGCSSSLVATHLACQSLRNGESSLALAGGVTVMATPLAFTEFARQRGLAADGRCKAFAAAADGVGWGEGAAVLVLERLSDAQRNQHPVLAVIAGSAVNQDGASNGLSAPNGPAQQRVIAQAVANAGIGLDQVDVVEAHGTGTTLGDPIEAGALIETYGAARSPERPLWLGSIKSNIGHTQAAAGAAGIIKMVAALQHGILPATLHVDAPSSHIDWSADTVRLLTEPVPWPETDHPRTAGVSSFGMSGTNAHLILQQAPEPVVSVVGGGEAGGGEAGGGEAVGEPALSVWAVSARHPAALSAQAGRLQRYLLDHPGLDLSDVAYSLATTRTHHPHRAAITVPADSGDPVAELLGALGALSVDRPYPGLTRHHHVGGQASKIVFVFPGQGAQYPGMGAQLYRHHRGFARLVDECDQALAPWTGWSVRDVLCQEPGAPSLERVDVVQPVLFTMMVSLAEVLGSYGIVPDAVIGHSQGEIAAAYVAGALTLAQAAQIVSLRSAALARLSGSGAMASVMLAAEQLGPRLQQWGAALSIAAINGPSHSIVSGDVDAVQQFSAACEQDGVQVRSIAVDYASHSAQVEALREQLLRDLAGLTPQPARVALYSTVDSARSGDPLDTTVMDAEYWYRNLREPVGFHDSVVELLARGGHTFVELSPHPGLAPAISDTVASAGARTSTVIPTLHRDRPELDALATALAQLHTHGHSPSWSALYPQANIVGLPTYPFEHRRYWLTPTPALEASHLGLERAEHPLIGAVTDLADQDQVVLSGRLSTTTQGWLGGHMVHDSVVFPGTGFVDVVLQAGQCAGCPVIDELVLQTPLVLVEDAPTDVQIVVAPLEQGRRRFSVHARTGSQHGAGVWTLHASGLLSAEVPQLVAPQAAPVGVEPIDGDGFYAGLAEHGYRYGGLFRSLRGIGVDPAAPDVVYARVGLPANTEVAGYGVHPALLDSALQGLAAVFFSTTAGGADAGTLRLPFVFGGVSLHATAATSLDVELTRTGVDTFRLCAVDPAGAPVISIDTLTLRAVPEGIGLRALVGAAGDSMFELAWSPLPDDSAAAPPVPEWAVVSEDPDRLPAALQGGVVHTELATLGSSPQLVIWPLPVPLEEDADPLPRLHRLTARTLGGLQEWLARAETSASRLVIVTRHAVSIGVVDRAPDMAHAAAWALIHSAQSEHPQRIVVLDTDDTAATEQALLATVARWPASEPQLVLRHGSAYLPRLVRARALTPPPTPCWRLGTTGKGDLANLALLPTEPSVLGPGQVRVGVRAAGLNFHDVVVAVGAVADEGLGGEAAGVVIETAPDVTAFRVGDAVMGLFPNNNAFAPTAVTDHRAVVAVPAGCSFAQAASVPSVFVTAYHALVDIAGLVGGQRLLIHAGAGGVGQAAIQIARHLGAQVYATAHPSKHGVLEGLGVPRGHIASSRTLDFGAAFGAATGGQGMDVVLNCLTGPFIDASLDLLARGGRFVEIGKTDVRSPAQIAVTHPGIGYHPVDVSVMAPERLNATLTTVAGMFAAGVLQPLPITSYGLAQAVRAFRDMSQARHTGKIVLLPPAVFDPQGTVLITGGTGTLGAVFAEHLVRGYGVRHLLLVSRSGAAAAGAGELHQRLTGLGAQVTISACDVSDPGQLGALLEAIPARHRLSAVIHAAAVLDDAVIGELTGEQLETVLAAKADAAWHLHHLTRDAELDAFVVFSSAAGVMGNAGQANYAAANAFCDALAYHRRHRHQATSLAWGYWQGTGLTAQLSSTEQTRLTRGGLVPISTDHGLALFDAALSQQQPYLIPCPVNASALARQARQQTLPAILSALTRARPQAATAAGPNTLAAQLAAQTPDKQLHTLTTLVTTATATVLAHPDPGALDTERPFKDLGIDSLTALELRNTLTTQTGLSLPATVIFDQPTPAALASHIHRQIGADGDIGQAGDPRDSEIYRLIASIPVKQLREAGILDMLLGMVGRGQHSQPDRTEDVANMNLDELLITLGD